VSGIAPRTGDLQAFATKGIGRGAQCIDVIQSQKMTPVQFVVWADENGVSSDEIAAGLGYVGADWPDLARATPLMAALAHRIGEDSAALAEYPPETRSLVAIQFGREGREGLAEAILGELTDAEYASMSDGMLYELPRCLQWPSTDLAAAMLARHGELHPERRPRLCVDLREIFEEGLRSEAVRDHVVPFAASALEALPPTDYWEDCLWLLICAYQQFGEHEEAIRNGQYWLERVHAMGVPPDYRDYCFVEGLIFDSMVAAGRGQEAAALMRTVLRECAAGSSSERDARRCLLRLVGEQPDLGPIPELPAHCTAVQPDQWLLTCDVRETVIRPVTIRGNALLTVSGATCDFEFGQVTVLPKRIHDLVMVQHVELKLSGGIPQGTHTGAICITTNDPERPTIEVPVVIEARINGHGPAQTVP